MKILAIGDLHGKLPVDAPKSADLILLTGDIGNADSARELSFKNKERIQKSLPELKIDCRTEKRIYNEIHYSTINMLNKLKKIAPVYKTQGNVGLYPETLIKRMNEKYNFSFESTLGKIRNMDNVYLIKNRIRNLLGLRIGFLEYFLDKSWIDEFNPANNKKLMKKAVRESEKANRILERFGRVDILLCHQPPYGTLDKVTNSNAPSYYIGKHAGSKVILDYINNYSPKYVICGHIHEGNGNEKIKNTEVINLV